MKQKLENNIAMFSVFAPMIIILIMILIRIII